MSSRCRQLEVGDRDEANLALMLQAHGYRAHVMAKGKSGSQPVDVIAFREGEIRLVDAKNVRSEEPSFPFSRIEQNQLTALRYAIGFAGLDPDHAGFVIFFERDLERPKFLPFPMYERMASEGRKSVNMSLLGPFEDRLKKIG